MIAAQSPVTLITPGLSLVVGVGLLAYLVWVAWVERRR